MKYGIKKGKRIKFLYLKGKNLKLKRNADIQYRYTIA